MTSRYKQQQQQNNTTFFRIYAARGARVFRISAYFFTAMKNNNRVV
jgi:hypothetical protein